MKPIVEILNRKSTTTSLGLLTLVGIAYLVSIVKTASSQTASSKSVCPSPTIPSGSTIHDNGWDNSWYDHDVWSEWCDNWADNPPQDGGTGGDLSNVL